MDVITYDAMHCLLSGGIAQNETDILLSSLQEVGVTFEHLREFVSARWKFCGTLGDRTAITGIFSTAREKAWREGSGFKAGASEMLLAFPLVMHFLHVVVSNMGLGVGKQVESYEKLGRVLAIVRLGKEGDVTGAELRLALREHGDAFEKAYPEYTAKPKDHWVHHIPSHVERDGLILDAFVGERKHQRIKAAALAVKNTESFEESVLLRVVAQQLQTLCEADKFRDRLRSPRPLEGVHGVSVSSSMVFRGTTLSVGDCMLVDGTLCFVKRCVEVDGVMFLASPRCQKQATVLSVGYGLSLILRLAVS